jgi:hypothetical protein
MKNIKEKIWLQILIIYTRYLIGGAFVFASIIKIKGKRFTSESGALNPIDSAWHFFETMYQSGLYWKFIGVVQLIAGCMLMTQRYAKLGALCNLPIITNIFIITLSYNFTNTPIITGMMLLANLMLIFWDWNELKVLVNLKPTYHTNKRLENDTIWKFVGLLLFTFTFFYRVFIDKYNLLLWFVICFSIGILGIIIGLRRRKYYK